MHYVAAKPSKTIPSIPKYHPNSNTKLPDLKWCKSAKKWPQNGQNDCLMAKNDPKWHKMVWNGQNEAVIPKPNFPTEMVENFSKIPKNGPKMSKMG